MKIKIKEFLLALTVISTPALADTLDTLNGEWPYYTGDIRGLRYSPLDQINADNFENLEMI